MIQAGWKEAVVYEVYIRSFKDSNGDGVGDLQGVLQKVDYLAELGVDIVWLCPFYKSPNDDNGYDIADYESIMDEFGTMDDVETLVDAFHKKGIKVLIDMVVNHTSDEHTWFLESKKDKTNPKRDYYIWKEGEEGVLPTNWESWFGVPCWDYEPNTGEYYLHYFSKKQPDLNWEHEPLRREIYAMMNRWLDKGVDGFRLDVINALAKPEGFPNSALKAEGLCRDKALYVNNPKLSGYLNGLSENVFAKRGIFTVGEMPCTTPEEALHFVREDSALNMVFHFETMHLSGMDLPKLKAIQKKWYEGVIQKGGWNSQFLSNHDSPRQVSKFGSDKEYHAQSAKMLAVLNLATPGTPFLYQGEEIGMTNCNFKKINQYRDIMMMGDYNLLRKEGYSEEEAVEKLSPESRDNTRTPMQWTDEENAGFTTGTPWIEVNPNYKKLNVKAQSQDEHSILAFYKALLKLRKQEKVFVYGDFIDLCEKDENVYHFSRTFENKKLTVILNVTEKERPLAEKAPKSTPVLSNYPKREQYTNLAPFEAVLFVETIAE